MTTHGPMHELALVLASGQTDHARQINAAITRFFTRHAGVSAHRHPRDPSRAEARWAVRHDGGDWQVGASAPCGPPTPLHVVRCERVGGAHAVDATAANVPPWLVELGDHLTATERVSAGFIGLEGTSEYVDLDPDTWPSEAIFRVWIPEAVSTVGGPKPR